MTDHSDYRALDFASDADRHRLLDAREALRGVRPRARCAHPACHQGIPSSRRIDAIYCSQRCGNGARSKVITELQQEIRASMAPRRRAVTPPLPRPTCADCSTPIGRGRADGRGGRAPTRCRDCVLELKRARERARRAVGTPLA